MLIPLEPNVGLTSNQAVDLCFSVINIVLEGTLDSWRVFIWTESPKICLTRFILGSMKVQNGPLVHIIDSGYPKSCNQSLKVSRKCTSSARSATLEDTSWAWLHLAPPLCCAVCRSSCCHVCVPHTVVYHYVLCTEIQSMSGHDCVGLCMPCCPLPCYTDAASLAMRD